MRRSICELFCCAMVLALISGYPAFGEPTADDAKEAVAEGKKDPAEESKKESGESKKKEEKKDEKKPAEKGKKEQPKKEQPKKEEPKKEEPKKAEPKKEEPKKEEAKKEEPKKEAAKPATQTVKRGPFKVEVGLDGVLEAESMTEVILRPEEWMGFTVLKAVEHGATVKRGDSLVTLDTEKIDKALADLRNDQQLSDLAMKQAEQALASLEALMPLDVADTERTKRMANEDLKQYNEVTRALNLKSAEFMMRYYRQNFEYQEEELAQLEKMYKADDITEETEKIVLKRARNAVEMARFYLERAQVNHDELLKFDLPRMDERIKDAVQRVNLQTDKEKVLLPLLLQKQRLEMDKLKVGKARSEERLKKLEADRAAMVINAPVDGVVYYGKCVRGKWGGSAAQAEQFHRGASLPTNDAFMTIVQTRPLLLRVAVPEKELHHVRTGVKGTAKPTAFPDAKLAAIVERVAAVPSGGAFDTRVFVSLDKQCDALMPGMNCELKLVPYEKADAISLPSAAVATDEADPDRRYVQVWKDGKTEKRDVTVGQRSDKTVEIVQGLNEGDEVLESPEKKK